LESGRELWSNILPAKARYHDAVKNALIKDGWTIEDEQFTLTIDKRNLWIDLRASKGEPQFIILIEVKELAEVDSAVEALANALGKYELYQVALHDSNFNYPLYLAVTRQSYDGILSERLGKLVLNRVPIPLLIFDAESEVILKWIP
jgi:hypothetical protein